MFTLWKKYLKYWIDSFLEENSEIYIQDLCLDNIFQFFFTQNEFNENKITDDIIKMGLFSIYGKGEYKRRSLIVPMILSKVLNNVGIFNTMMQSRGTMVVIKGNKTNSDKIENENII